MTSRASYDATPGVNFSTLKHIQRSPAHYQAALHEPRDDEDEAKFAVGTLVHAMVLENKSLLDLYALKPKGMSFATSEGKLWKAQQTLPILKEEDANSVPRMAESIKASVTACSILRACLQREHAITGDIEGVEMKALLDSIGVDAAGNAVLADLKTTLDARPAAFAKKALDLDYDLQMEIYCRLHEVVYGKKPGFVWIVVEKSAPFASACYYPDEDMWASGRRKLERCLNLLKTSRTMNHWPAYGDSLQPLSPPKWALKEDRS